MPSNWLSVRRFVPLFFVPAGTGLVWDALHSETLALRLLAWALILFCLELAVMAKVDLDNIAAVRQEDSRLYRFSLVVNSTIVLELIGFYIALISSPAGALMIILSQLWFNLLAQIQLCPKHSPAVVSFGISQRVPLILANGVGLVLLSLWFLSALAFGWELGFVMQMRRWLGGGLLALVVLFLSVKYVTLGAAQVTNNRRQPAEKPEFDRDLP